MHPLDLLPELALGVLPEAEAAPVRQHLATCTSCEAEYREMLKVANALPLAMEDREPSPSVREAVMDRIRVEPVPLQAARSARRFPAWAGALAAGLLVLAAGTGGFFLGVSDDDGVSQAQFERYAGLVRAMIEGDVTRIEGSADDASVVLVNAPGSDLTYAWVEGFPALPEGKAYQLWTSRDGDAVEPGRVFTVDTGGFWFSTDDPVDQYALLAFTIEDEAGADAPSQQPFLAINPRESARLITP